MKLSFTVTLVIMMVALVLGGLFLFGQGKTEDTKVNNLELFTDGVGEYTTSIRIKESEVFVEIVTGADERVRGLSGRPSLDESHGMLFAFAESAPHSFWMKDMRFSIDIVWIDSDAMIIDIARNVPFDSYPQIFTPSAFSRFVLEVSAGWTNRHGVKIGDIVTLPEEFGAVKKDLDVSKNIVVESTDTLILFDVPFTSQAPQAQWNDPVYSNGCEEAVALMAIKWVRGETITALEARDEIKAMADFAKKAYGFHLDLSAADTVRLMKDYFVYSNLALTYGIDTDDILRELRRGNLVIVPVDGRLIGNPYFTPPGPETHMIVVRGYDPVTNEFITNDPGTRRGEAFRYSKSALASSLRDYDSGYHVPQTEKRTAMIIVKK